MLKKDKQKLNQIGNKFVAQLEHLSDRRLNKTTLHKLISVIDDFSEELKQLAVDIDRRPKRKYGKRKHA